MSRHSIVRLLGVLFVLVSVACESPTGPGDPLPVTRILQGAFSSADTSQRLVVRSQAELSAAWATMFRDESEPPALPTVDFSRDMVIIALAGGKPSGGYCIFVQAATSKNGLAEVMIRSIGPSPSSLILPVVTHPYDVVRVPRREIVRFNEVSEVGNCGPLT